MAQKTNGKTKTKKPPKDVDLRKLPKDKRPKPTSGQSCKEFQLASEELTDAEKKLVKTLDGAGKGLRETFAISDIASKTKLSLLEVRNTLRRLVPSTWVERVTEVLTDEGETAKVRGHYRISERGRKRWN